MRALTAVLFWLVGATAALAEVALDGHLVQGGFAKGQVAPGTVLLLGDTAVPVHPQGHFILGFGRDAALTQTLRIVPPDGNEITQTIQLSARSYNIQRIEGVADKYVSPPESVLARIREEAALVRAAREQVSAGEQFLQRFQWPLLGPVTGVYGSQRIYNGEPRRPHFGIDIAAAEGTSVMAPAGGVVKLAHPDMYFSGGTLVLDHGHGLTSTFIHLSAILVQPGDTVSQGQAIAKVGSTGRSTGPHLDWRMNWFDARIDPAFWVPPMP